LNGGGGFGVNLGTVRAGPLKRQHFADVIRMLVALGEMF
jgi:hypothetical protein